MSHINNKLRNKMDRETVEMTYQKEDNYTQMDFSTNQQSLRRTGRQSQKNRSPRSVLVCLVVLCVLLLTAVIVLCVLNYTHHQRDTQSKNKLWKILNEADGWIYYQSSFYLISTEEKTWSESRNYCTQKGADLIIINNKEEQDFVQKLPVTEYIWIGLSDSDVEGRWKWVDGSTLTSSFWLSGEPNSYGGDEDCVVSTSSGWNDFICHSTLNWICEKKIILE